jgi:hypothetical protein
MDVQHSELGRNERMGKQAEAGLKALTTRFQDLATNSVYYCWAHNE